MCAVTILFQKRLILYEGIGPVTFVFNKAHPLFQILIHDLPNDRPKHTTQSFASQRFGWRLSAEQTEFLTIYRQAFGFHLYTGMMLPGRRGE
jgi:hypothetical protein